VAISKTTAPSKGRTLRDGAAEKTRPANDGACFNDWKRFCSVLREIASGENGHPLSGLEAQKRAQAVLNECGYTLPSRVQAQAAKVTPTAAPESLDTEAQVDSEQSSAEMKLNHQ